MPIIHEVAHRVRIPLADVRAIAKAPPDATIDIVGDELHVRWAVEDAAPSEAPPEPKKKAAKREEAPVIAPPPVEVDWATALNDATRITAADLKRAEEEAGAEKIVAVRGRLSLGAGVTCAQIALQSNGREYFDALRAGELGAK
jgi:hypothetical protein